MNAYVVTHWHASNTPDKNGNYVSIVGRGGGLVDYILTLLKLNPTIQLQASDMRLTFAESSLFGDRNVCTPLAKVTSTIYGWNRPVRASIFFGFVTFTILSFAFALFDTLWFGLVDGPGRSLGDFNWVAFWLRTMLRVVLITAAAIAVAVLYFRLNRTLTLGIVTESGETYWLRLKRSVIENFKLDQPLAEAASKVIDSLVLARCAGTQTNAPASASPQAQAAQLSGQSSPSHQPASAATGAAAQAQPALPASAATSPPPSSATPDLKAECVYCTAKVAFPPAMLGQEVACPTCSKPLLLVVS